MPRFVVLCATTGTGQTTLCFRLRQLGFNVPPVVTTRALRDDELQMSTHIAIDTPTFIAWCGARQLFCCYDRAGCYYAYRCADCQVDEKEAKAVTVLSLPPEIGLLFRSLMPEVVLVWLAPLASYSVRELLQRSKDNPIAAITRILAVMAHDPYKPFVDLVLQDCDVSDRVARIIHFLEEWEMASRAGASPVEVNRNSPESSDSKASS
jgi:guanylate kinase